MRSSIEILNLFLLIVSFEQVKNLSEHAVKGHDTPIHRWRRRRGWWLDLSQCKAQTDVAHQLRTVNISQALAVSLPFMKHCEQIKVARSFTLGEDLEHSVVYQVH